MLSWSNQVTLFQQLISDTDATNLLMGKTLINQGQRRLQAILGLYYSEETRTFATVASQLAYVLPENFRSLTNLYVTSGTTQYEATLIQDDELWRQMQSATTQQTSNYLQFCFVRRNRIELYPIPSSALTATIIYQTMAKDLSIDDYTTGTITTLANAGTAVTGDSSVWTSAMVGRYFKIDADGEWYKISAFGTTTTLTLDSAYQGVAIAAGTSAYTIGQMPISPPETHELAVYYAVWKYFLFRKDVQMAREFERMWKEGVSEAEAAWANRSSSNVTKGYPYASRRRAVNPNMFPTGMT